MKGISAYDSSSIGVLFSSLSGGAQKTSGGSADLLGISYTDYASIRSGSYHKLLSAYYGQGRNVEGVTDSIKTSTSTAKDDAKTLAKIENSAEGLKDSADAMLADGKKSLFEKTTTTDENGVKKTGYDTDAIYKAADKFVKSYNDLLDKAGASDTTNILRAAKTMVNYSKVNEKSLEKMGITIGSDNKLSIDEETFKKADMSKAKSLFHSKGSYGYQISKQASLIDSYAKSEAMRANTYGRNAMYTYNYNTGELYNSGI